MRTGPKYLICGSRLSDDLVLLRALLEGLNTEGRQWSETIVIMDDGTLPGLEGEVRDFKHLEHRRVKQNWRTPPNIVIAVMDRLTQNRDTEKTLIRAESQGIPAYVLSRYGP